MNIIDTTTDVLFSFMVFASLWLITVLIVHLKKVEPSTAAILGLVCGLLAKSICELLGIL